MWRRNVGVRAAVGMRWSFREAGLGFAQVLFDGLDGLFDEEFEVATDAAAFFLRSDLDAVVHVFSQTD